MTVLDAVLGAVDQGLEASIGRLFELLQIPSVSADPACAGACRAAAAWLVGELQGIGFAARSVETAGLPIVLAHRAGPPQSPHVLFYGHYDVQPADPLEKWSSPPFEPVRRKDSDGRERIYARGACDDKGQLMTFIEASRAWIAATGGLPCSVTVMIEGEEETDSAQLVPFLKSRRRELAADVVLVCDTGMLDARTPAITTRLRGCVTDEVEIAGPAIDLHSGMYGGAAVNPLQVLAAILGGLHDARGRVTIRGFYDGVKPPTAAERKGWRSIGFSEKRFLADAGLRSAAGDPRYPVLEKVWARPTAEINGVTGGYSGPGPKTVIPAKASAKLSFRLVGGQDPAKIKKAFRAFVKERLPPGAKAAFPHDDAGSPAVTVAEGNPFLAAAEAALFAEWKRAPVRIGSGGSIPVVGEFQRILGLESLLVGFSLDDDAIHSPNEKYDVACYHRGARSWARILGAIAG
jgi:acetylornithine deacetylase/succinyl-diaminopimelate desuccinylase-like protein